MRKNVTDATQNQEYGLGFAVVVSSPALHKCYGTCALILVNQRRLGRGTKPGGEL